MMALETHGPDTFVGVGPEYPWGGLYGGQIVAQGLRAAGLTVDDGLHPHSLHAYFVRRGDATEPIRFEVSRVRNGRSFVTRSVEARQSTGAILTMTASFQTDEDAPDAQRAHLPLIAPAGEYPPGGWSPIFDRRFVNPPGNEGGVGDLVQAWVKVNGSFGSDRLLHACALAYASDDLPADALVGIHPVALAETGASSGESISEELAEGTSSYMVASLDHALWFHRPFQADDWHLQTFRADGVAQSRGVSVGQFFSPDGVHIATVAQEVLVRVRART